ncbi:MAG TPA: secretin N-terminal domain-containing protein [Steroidobacteraceae bacterium]
MPTVTLSLQSSRRCVGRLTAAWFAVLLATCAVAQDMQIIELRHRMADEILPILQPLVESGGVITGSDNLLIVRTSAHNFEQIQQAVALLDRAARQLLISVRQGNAGSDSSTDVRGAATIGNGDVQVGVNRPPGAGSGVQVQGSSRTQQTGQGNVSSVRALEGSETYIAIGQSRPITTTSVTPGWHGSVVTQTTEFRDASSGFYATARVSGEQVTLEISPQQQAFRSRGSIETQGLTTTVAGRLGEWLPIGAVRNQSSGATNGVLVWGRQSSESEYSVAVKVEEIP